MIESPDLRRTDFYLLSLLVLLSLVGIVVLRGATQSQPWLEPYAIRQTAWLCIGLILFFGVMLFDYHQIETLALGLYGIHVVLLGFLLAMGRSVKGARSWIDLGPVNWQPAETMKIAVVLLLARVLAVPASSPAARRGLRWIVLPCVIAGIPAALVAVQPDIGTASIYAAILLGMLFWAGASRRILIGFLVIGMLSGAAAFPFLKPYQQKRIISFINPGADPLGAGYNLEQAKIALGSGRLTGKGWALGTQTTMEFLPEHQTDFIYASLGEQFGLAGCLAVLAIYALIAWRGLDIVATARDSNGALIAGGMMTVFLAHVAVNLGMAMGLMPVTGLPLPLLSAGGSSLVTNFLLFGLVANVALRRYVFQ